MTLQSQLETRLQILAPRVLRIDNESRGHGGYYEGKESHFKVTIVSDAFAGLRWCSVIKKSMRWLVSCSVQVPSMRWRFTHTPPRSGQMMCPQVPNVLINEANPC